MLERNLRCIIHLNCHDAQGGERVRVLLHRVGIEQMMTYNMHIISMIRRTAARHIHHTGGKIYLIREKENKSDYSDPLTGDANGGGGTSSGGSGCGDSDTESRGGKSSSNKKRGLFPKQATNILRAWLFQNLSVSSTLNRNRRESKSLTLRRLN